MIEISDVELPVGPLRQSTNAGKLPRLIARTAQPAKRAPLAAEAPHTLGVQVADQHLIAIERQERLIGSAECAVWRRQIPVQRRLGTERLAPDAIADQRVEMPGLIDADARRLARQRQCVEQMPIEIIGQHTAALIGDIQPSLAERQAASGRLVILGQRPERIHPTVRREAQEVIAQPVQHIQPVLAINGQSAEEELIGVRRPGPQPAVFSRRLAREAGHAQVIRVVPGAGWAEANAGHAPQHRLARAQLGLQRAIGGKDANDRRLAIGHIERATRVNGQPVGAEV